MDREDAAAGRTAVDLGSTAIAGVDQVGIAGRNGVCAVVVSYRPDSAIADRLHGVASQVQCLVVVDNTEDEATAQLPPSPRLPEQSVVIRNPGNLGVATALNQGLRLAAANNCRWLLTLDQDSECRSDMVRSLLTVAALANPVPAVIGSNYFDPKRRRHEVEPLAWPGAFEERKTVITSGCLVEVGFARAIGGFRDDYFIDQLDHEFCLRVRARGRRVVISTKPMMRHSVGGPSGPMVPFVRQQLPNHTPSRKYYITRNSVATMRDYWPTEPLWCLKRMIKLFLGLGGILIVESDRAAKVRAFAAGIRDAVSRRMVIRNDDDFSADGVPRDSTASPSPHAQATDAGGQHPRTKKC